eukprot:jgi/Bigna1/62300/fgenesh1_kg.33_\
MLRTAACLFPSDIPKKNDPHSEEWKLKHSLLCKCVKFACVRACVSRVCPSELEIPVIIGGLSDELPLLLYISTTYVFRCLSSTLLKLLVSFLLLTRHIPHATLTTTKLWRCIGSPPVPYSLPAHCPMRMEE